MAIEKPRFLMPVTAAGQGDAHVISALALQILLNRRVQLSRLHVSGVRDHATAGSNTVQQMFESAAQRSHYQGAPGGGVALDVRVLRAIAALSNYYTMTISEVAGGSHSKGSLHYKGAAFDVNVINGKPVRLHHADLASFVADCKALGANQVIGPPSAGHHTHVHAGWK
jgi:hypothetical protein